MSKKLLIILFITIILLSNQLDSLSLKQEQIKPIMLSSQIPASIAGTFNHFLSDVFYLNSIQIFPTAIKPRELKFKVLINRLEIAQKLDPKFLAVQLLGGAVFPVRQDEVKIANQFLIKSFKENKKDWQIPYWIGFNYAYSLNDPENALKYFKIAAQYPDAPNYLVSNQPMLYYRADDLDDGLKFLQQLNENYKKKGVVKKWIESKIEWTKDLIYLRAKADDYYKKFAKYPQSLNDLVTEKFIRFIPEDKFGNGYYWDKKNLTVKSRL